MIKRNILIGLCVFFLGLSTSTYAADTEVVLDTNDSSSGFTVKDSGNQSLMRVGGDGIVTLFRPSDGAEARIFYNGAYSFPSNGGNFRFGPSNSVNIGGVSGNLSLRNSNPELVLKSNVNNGEGFILTTDEGSFTLKTHENFDQQNRNTRMVVTNTGNVGIGRTDPGHPLHMGSGAHVTVSGVWTNNSSRVYKENIENLSVDNALETLEGLKPVTFKYKAEESERYVGFIAEDVPELVATQDRKGLSPMDITAVLTKVVQEQQTMLKEQQEVISALSVKVKSLEDRI